MLVQHAIQPASLILIPRDAVRDLLGRVAMEMVGLSLHGSDAGIEEEKPVVDFIRLATTGWIGDLVLGLVVLLDEILHDAAGFEESNAFAVGEGVREGGDAAVGVDFEEPGLFLGVGLNVDIVGCVGEAVGGWAGISLCISTWEDVGGTYPSSSRVIEILMPFGVWVV